MKQFKVFFAVLLGFAVCSFAIQDEFTAVKNTNAILLKLKEVSSKTSAIVADFTEEKKMAAFTKPQVSSGKFYYALSDKMRWEQQKPFEYIILISGKSLRIKDNGVEKKIGTNNRMIAQINAFMLNLIQGNYTENKNFKISCFESASKYKIELIPLNRSVSNIYKQLHLYFDKSDSRLQKIHFFEASGDTKTMIFSNQVYNKAIVTSTFTNL